MNQLIGDQNKLISKYGRNSYDNVLRLCMSILNSGDICARYARAALEICPKHSSRDLGSDQQSYLDRLPRSPFVPKECGQAA
jgi:hypothetical protein